MNTTLLEVDHLPPFVSWSAMESVQLATWLVLSLGLLFAIANFKTMPGVWTWRVLSKFHTGFRAQLRRTASSPLADNLTRRVAIVKKASPSCSIQEHPLFVPTIYSTHVAPAEIDINLHKSNSTYFTDLDIARSELIGRIIAPAWPMDNMLIEYTGRDGALRRERVKGAPAFILGATYTSFKSEMSVYTSYNVESRVLGWDARWLYIGSWFVAKKGKKLYACSLSKYILKKGRITVKPELLLADTGWIPARRGASTNDDAEIQDAAGWGWDEIETYRKEGMAIVDAWGETDLRLEKGYGHTMN